MSVFRLKSTIGGALLILPLVLFLGLVFFAPLAGMLGLSIIDKELREVLPRTIAALEHWEGGSAIPELAYEAVVRDLFEARQAKTVGIAARRLSYDVNGLRSVVTGTARALPKDISSVSDWKEALIAADQAWANPEIWQVIVRSRGPVSDFFLLSAIDLRRDAAGSLHRAGNEGLYVSVLLRTFVIALTVTLICLLLALPAAELLASASATVSGLLMLVLLLPLWTSVLVRSASWLVILQTNGIVNQALMKLQLISEPLALVYNRAGVLIALTHILLPYAVLPLYGVMKSLPKNQMLAASSLGAGPVEAFFRIYLPQIAPGVSAGGLLVFILALGYYITPLLLGGAGDQLLPFYIAYNTTQSINWGLASALGSILLVATVVLYTVYVRLVGVERIGLG